MATYTEKEVKILHELYGANPCLEVVDKLSVKLNKPRKSIISKLVKEGIYVTRRYTDKRGNTPITKLAIVRSIENSLSLQLPGLDKAPKGTLIQLEQNISEMSTVLDELQECYETINTLQEMIHVSSNDKK
jgi:hypothetical protein